MRILGIDPGSNATGYGVVDALGGRLRHVAHGTLRGSAGQPLATRIGSLFTGIGEVVALQRPDVAIVEEVFIASSPRSALVLGQARGAVLAALSVAGVPLREYAARTIKQAVAGTGGADKRQVQRMVARLLDLDRLAGADPSDALAAAICHANSGRLAELGASSARRRGRRPSSPRAGYVVRRAR